MSSPETSHVDSGNQLLEQLPVAERDHMLAQFDEIELPFATTLLAACQQPTHVYFPSTAFISLIASVDNSDSIEVGLVGREGMMSAQIIIDGGRTTTRAVVQGEGHALCMDRGTFHSELASCPALRETLRRYLRVVIDQSIQHVPCNRFHGLEPRLARWLLMAHDRIVGDTFRLTQEFLSYMLGVRRAGVSEAASKLHRRALIHYRRGVLTILDRKALEDTACSCYATDAAIYDRLITNPAID